MSRMVKKSSIREFIKLTSDSDSSPSITLEGCNDASCHLMDCRSHPLSPFLSLCALILLQALFSFFSLVFLCAFDYYCFLSLITILLSLSLFLFLFKILTSDIIFFLSRTNKPDKCDYNTIVVSEKDCYVVLSVSFYWIN